jgi:hypothetical protein
MQVQRRAVFFCFLLLLAGSQAWRVAAQVDWPHLRFTQIATTARPTSIADPGDGSGRLFVTDQSGRVLLVQSNSVTPFLDIHDRVEYFAGSEYGLLSVVFPPGFATNQYFYAYYDRFDGASTVSRFFVTSTNFNLADPSTEQVVLSVPAAPSPQYTLSGGLLLFGPDGTLYVGMGDTGFTADSVNQAQNPQSLRGKILRLDVESSTNGYRIPSNNPFVNNTNYLPEIWALGLRNPWRFSFDSATGDLYIGDVGQNESEEVDFKPATVPAGQNYGWPIREGLHLYAGPDFPGVPLVDPVWEYLHTGPPASITGGFVFRGPGAARMTGLYFYADAYSGKIWGLKHDGTNWVNQQLAKMPYFLSTFGEDQVGRLYVADYVSGNIYFMDDDGAADPPTFYPPGTNSFTENITLDSISPNAIIRYTTNGLDPAGTDPGVASGGIVTISSGIALKARAFRADLLPSPVTQVSYSLKVARPTFFPGMGPVTNGQPIGVLCLTPGATIRYTLDGSDPTTSSQSYLTPVPFTGATLKARGFRTGFADSETALFSSSPIVIENFQSGSLGIYNSFSCQGLRNWSYQVQVGEDPTRWRNYGGAQLGTNATLFFQPNNVYPPPLRRLFRLEAVQATGL